MSYSQLVQTCQFLRYRYSGTIETDPDSLTVVWRVPTASFNFGRYNTDSCHLLDKIFPPDKYTRTFDTINNNYIITIHLVDPNKDKGYTNNVYNIERSRR